MALLSRHSNIFLQRKTLINYSNLLAGPHDKRCRTRTSPPAGRFETSWGEVCRGLALSVPRPLARLRCTRPHTFSRAQKWSSRIVITRASQAKITLSLVSFTVVLRNVTQCFMMSPPPPPHSLGGSVAWKQTNDCKRDNSYFINFKRDKLKICTSVRPGWSRLLIPLQPWIIVPF